MSKEKAHQKKSKRKHGGSESMAGERRNQCGGSVIIENVGIAVKQQWRKKWRKHHQHGISNGGSNNDASKRIMKNGVMASKRQHKRKINQQQ